MVMLALPLLLTTTDFDDEFPTATLPKLNEEGFRDRNADAGATAVAVSGTEAGEFAASLATVKFPDTVPALCGLKRMLIVALCPGERVSGRATPETLKPAPVTLN